LTTIRDLTVQGLARAVVKCSIKEGAYCSQAINMEQQVANKS